MFAGLENLIIIVNDIVAFSGLNAFSADNFYNVFLQWK